MEFFFGDMSLLQVIALSISAILIGINKTGIPGLGLVPVMILIYAFPKDVGLSTGMQLVMLCIADLMAIAYYRRGADWKMVFRLLPCALAGLGVGYIAMEYIKDIHLDKIIGVIILLLSALNYIRRKYWSSDKVPTSIWFTIAVGLAAGFTTMVANAAGPISSLYLLAMKLPKETYMGTCAWFFLILNWLKLPIFALEGRVTLDSVKLDLCMLPCIIFGGFLGIVLLRKMPQKIFEYIIQTLVVIASVRLLWG